MNLVACTPVRNESWVLGASLRGTLRWCDSVVVLAHCCTDTTVDVVMDVAIDNPGRVHLIVESDPQWKEMDHRQRLLEEARGIKATHIALVDADEILTANLVQAIRPLIETLSPGTCAMVGMPCIWRSLDQYRVDPGLWSERWDLSLAFADRGDLGWRTENGYDYHHRHPYGGVQSQLPRLQGGVMHLQWASWRRLVAKQVWYQMMEILKYPEKSLGRVDFINYGKAMDETGLKLADVPEEWWGEWAWLKRFVNLGEVSWCEGECKRLVEEYGVERFKGVVGLEVVCSLGQ